MARNKKLNQLLDSSDLQSSELLSYPLAQPYSAELFRHTLLQQLSPSTLSESDSQLNQSKARKWPPESRNQTSINPHLQPKMQPQYRHSRYYTPKSHRIFFTRYSNLRQPWRQVGVACSLTISASTATTSSTNCRTLLVQIADQKRHECAVCRYAFRNGQRE